MGSNVQFWAWQWWLSGYSKTTTEGRGIEGSNPLCFRDLGLVFFCQTLDVLPASLGISAPTSHPFVTRIITYTITVNLQINTVDLSYVASSQQNVVGGRSVEGLRYERPIFEGVGKWLGDRQGSTTVTVSWFAGRTCKSHSMWYTYLLNCVTQFTFIMKNKV
jgi:hypothetical protein